MRSPLEGVFYYPPSYTLGSGRSVHEDSLKEV
jgi:hypothetical protein